jgi:apolipoprotein N-acyltransferase
MGVDAALTVHDATSTRTAVQQFRSNPQCGLMLEWQSDPFIRLPHEHRRQSPVGPRKPLWPARPVARRGRGQLQGLALSPDARLWRGNRPVADALPARAPDILADSAPGAAFDLRSIDGTRYGLAICKDMHFAAMGRAYGERQAQAMLVPAWDFGADGSYAERLSALRGVESGFAMVRAAREGLLTVTDAYGRIVAETPSAVLPGASLLAHVPAGPPLPTSYRRSGDLFGWLCTGAALACMVAAWRREPQPAARAGQA